MSWKEITLTRRQIERLAVFLALQENIERVTIQETNETGIGPAHWAVYRTTNLERNWEEEITDVGSW